MNISGIRPSVGFYDQNSIRFNPALSSMSIEETQEPAVEETSASVSSDEEMAAARQGQTFGSYDFASQYKPGEVHELKGTDSDIKSLDVERAVNDMQKDSAIHRYQYFVQNKGKGEDNSAARGSENFTL
jgi:hypothetical protein